MSEAQNSSQGRVREPDADANNHDRRDRERPTGPALKKRDFLGANHVDYQRLRDQRFDEPASLENWSTRRVPTTKQVQHHEVSCIVENRSDRTDTEDKPGNLTNLPAAWLRGFLWPNVIGRNRNLRKVVQKIVREHLQGRQRAKRQEGTRAKNTE